MTITPEAREVLRQLREAPPHDPSCKRARGYADPCYCPSGPELDRLWAEYRRLSGAEWKP